MDKRVAQLAAMIMIGIGVVVIAVAVRDAWLGSATIAQVANNASHLIAVPTAVAGWQPARLDLMANSKSIVKVP